MQTLRHVRQTELMRGVADRLHFLVGEMLFEADLAIASKPAPTMFVAGLS